MPRPTHVQINGKDYSLVEGEGSFENSGEPRLVQQGDIAGASRPSKTARPDILSWKWDDWSLGEGTRFVRSDDPDTFSAYQDSDDAVDIAMVGELRRGRNGATLTNSLTTAARAVLARGQIGSSGFGYLSYDSSTNVRLGLLTTTTMTDVALITSVSAIRGQPVSVGARVWVPTSTGLFMYDGAVTDWTSTLSGEHSNPVISSGRLYFTRDVTAGTELYQASLETANQHVLVGTIAGEVKSACTESDGDNVYVLVSNSSDSSFLYRWDGTALTEFAAVPHYFRTSQLKRPTMRAVNGVLFVGGYIPADNSTEFDQPCLLFFTESESGIVVTMETLRLRTAGARRITALEVGPKDTLLIGLEAPTGAALTDLVMAYDLRTGGFSHYMRPDSLSSATNSLHVSSFFFAGGSTSFLVNHLSASNTVLGFREKGRDATTKVAGPIWDFDLPEEEKILLSAEVHTSALAAGDIVELSFVLDDSTVITTDATEAANSLRHETDGATRKNFTMTDTGTERIFRFLEPRVEITGTGATQGTTGPTVYSVSMRATTAGTQQFLNARISLSNQSGKSRVPGRSVTARKQQEELEALFTSTSNRVFDVKPFYEKPGGQYPKTSDTYVCVLHSYRFIYDRPGEGECAVTFRVIG